MVVENNLGQKLGLRLLEPWCKGAFEMTKGSHSRGIFEGPGRSAELRKLALILEMTRRVVENSPREEEEEEGRKEYLG